MKQPDEARVGKAHNDDTIKQSDESDIEEYDEDMDRTTEDEDGKLQPFEMQAYLTIDLYFFALFILLV